MDNLGTEFEQKDFDVQNVQFRYTSVFAALFKLGKYFVLNNKKGFMLYKVTSFFPSFIRLCFFVYIFSEKTANTTTTKWPTSVMKRLVRKQ